MEKERKIVTNSEVFQSIFGVNCIPLDWWGKESTVRCCLNCNRISVCNDIAHNGREIRVHCDNYVLPGQFIPGLTINFKGSVPDIEALNNIDAEEWDAYYVHSLNDSFVRQILLAENGGSLLKWTRLTELFPNN